MNTVVLVGKVCDRPFRPGNGERVVAKMTVNDESGRSSMFEFDAFGEMGGWVMSNLWVGDIVSMRGRLEERVYKERGEEVEELRIVGLRVSIVSKGNRQREPRDGDGRRPDQPQDPNVASVEVDMPAE